MAATCSESGLKAMSDAIQLQGKSTIHTVDGYWLMQVYPVEVTHARQRSLTLLEHYILKAFNEIPSCTARDIIIQFGLDPLLVDSTLRTLKLCNTIDSIEEVDWVNPTDGTILALNRELKGILDRLAVDGGNAEQLKELERKRSVLQQQIQRLQKTSASREEDRFSKMKFEVNALGKEALVNKYMKEPTEMRIYSFVRCMTTGMVHIVGSTDIEHGAIERGWPNKDAAIWQNKRKDKWSQVEPTRGEIEAILSSLHTNEAIEINTIEVLESRFENREVHLPLHFTLTVGHEDQNQEWLVHLQREHIPRIKWIEKYLKQLNSQHPALLKHLANSLPKVSKQMTKTLVNDASPLVRLDRLVGKERTQQGILVVHEHEQLTNIIDMPLPSLDNLLTSRTMVCLSQQLKKNYKFKQANDSIPPSFTIPSNNIMPRGTIALGSGFFEVGFISIPFSSQEELHLPVLCHSRALGEETVAKVDEYLRTLLSPEHLFLMTNSPADLEQWILAMISSIKSKNVESILESFRDAQAKLSLAVEPVGLAHMHAVIEAFVDRHGPTCLNTNHGIKELLEIVEDSRCSPNEMVDCWATIERSVHAVAVEASSSEKNSDLFTLWKEVRQRKQAIPWEEMANLEDTLIGNCTMTRFEVNRHMELIVKDLIVGNRRQVSDLAGMLNDLRKIDVIDEKLHAELKKTKAGRNMLTHEHDMDADLPHTLEAIKTMRLMATLTDPIDDPRWATKDEYQNFSWNFSIEGINQYLKQCHDLARSFGKEHKFNQAVWFDSLQTRLPITYTEIPFDVAETLQNITDLKCGLSGDSIKEKVLKDAASGWAQSLEPPVQYTIPSAVIEASKELSKHGLEKEARNIAEALLKKVPTQSTLEALLEEVNHAGETLEVISPQNAIIRWKRTIEHSEFSVQLNGLGKANKEALTRMGKTNTEKLLKTALEHWFGKDFSLTSIESGIEELDRFISAHPEWDRVLSTLENWLSERCTRLLKQGTEEHMLAWLEEMANKTLKTTKLTRFKTKLQAIQKNLERKIERAKKDQEAKSQAKTQSGKKAKKGKGGKKK
jgi:hypothetical protein